MYILFSFWGIGRLAVASNFGDTWRGATLTDMVAGTAERPYVYRALVPATVGLVVQITPAFIEQAVNAWPLGDSTVLRSLAATKDFLSVVLGQTDRYYMRLVAMLVMYGFLIGYMVAMYKLAAGLFPDAQGMRLFMPIIGVCFIPMLANKIAYVYDIAELALAAACYYALLARKWRWYYLWFILACINKETAIFSLIFFALWSRTLMPRDHYRLHLAAQGLIFLLVRGSLLLLFSANPGVILKTDYMSAHAALFLQGMDVMFLLALAASAFLLLFRFQEKPAFARKGLWIFGLVFASYIIFGKPLEYRVFYAAVPFLAVLLTHTLVMTTGLQETLFNQENHKC